MSCAEFSAQLAVFRELGPDERERLQAHLATCPDCAATLAAYMEQDRLLSSLPALQPSAKLIANVLAWTVGRRGRQVSWRWVSVTLAILLVFFAAVGGTINAAAEALPGDTLYPVKRTVERVCLTFTFSPTARESYERLLTMTRLEETRKVLQQGREADVEFQGPLEVTANDEWLVSGVKVQVPPEAWAQTPPQPGVLVKIEGRAASGQLTARRVDIVSPKTATPALEVSPTVLAKPSPTASPKRNPTSTQESIAFPTPQPSDTSEPEPMPSPSTTPAVTRWVRLTWTPRIVPSLTREPTRTPEPWQPTTEPSATIDDARSLTPKARRTLLPRPTMRPTRTPSILPLTPAPTSTPEAIQPTPSCTQTPRGPIHTPKPSPTPRSPEPARTPKSPRPSPTATFIEDQPRPSDTPMPPTSTPQPTHTSIPPTPRPPTRTPGPPTRTLGPTPTPTCPLCYTVTPEGGRKRT